MGVWGCGFAFNVAGQRQWACWWSSGGDVEGVEGVGVGGFAFYVARQRWWTCWFGGCEGVWERERSALGSLYHGKTRVVDILAEEGAEHLRHTSLHTQVKALQVPAALNNAAHIQTVIASLSFAGVWSKAQVAGAPAGSAHHLCHCSTHLPPLLPLHCRPMTWSSASTG